MDAVVTAAVPFFSHPAAYSGLRRARRGRSGCGARERRMSASGDETSQRNGRAALSGAALVLTMIGLTYAAVPFYAAFCRATGYEGTTQIAKTDAGFEGRRTLRVAFDANVAPGLPWSLEPETDALVVRTGRTATVFFRARNLSDKPTAA